MIYIFVFYLTHLRANANLVLKKRIEQDLNEASYPKTFGDILARRIIKPIFKKSGKLADKTI